MIADDVQEPQEPRQGICRSCGAPTDKYATLCLIHQDEWHHTMRTLRRLIRIGIYSDWPSGCVGHAQMQTDAALIAKTPGWDCEFAVILRDEHVSWEPGDDSESKWDALAQVDADAAIARLLVELRAIAWLDQDAA